MDQVRQGKGTRAEAGMRDGGHRPKKRGIEAPEGQTSGVPLFYIIRDIVKKNLRDILPRILYLPNMYVSVIHHVGKKRVHVILRNTKHTK